VTRSAFPAHRLECPETAPRRCKPLGWPCENKVFASSYIQRELGKRFDLAKATERGLLPSIYFSDDPRADLQSYAGSYLQQEIVAEGATRNIPAFSRFLKVAALCNATIVNFTNVANDAQVKRTTVYEYFEILKDTLILYELSAWRKTRKRKPLASSKYFFFDVGVVSALQGRAFRPGTPEFGEALETYLMHELTSYSDYVSQESLSYWRSTTGFEVDFIVGDHTAVEVKAKENVSAPDLKSIRARAEKKQIKLYLCVTLKPRSQKIDGVTVLPVHKFLNALWGEKYNKEGAVLTPAPKTTPKILHDAEKLMV